MRKTDSHTAFMDEVEFREMFESLHNSLVGNEDTTVQSRHEEGQKFISSPLTAFKLKDVVKILDHWLEQLVD